MIADCPITNGFVMQMYTMIIIIITKPNSKALLNCIVKKSLTFKKYCSIMALHYCVSKKARLFQIFFGLKFSCALYAYYLGGGGIPSNK